MGHQKAPSEGRAEQAVEGASVVRVGPGEPVVAWAVRVGLGAPVAAWVEQQAAQGAGAAGCA